MAIELTSAIAANTPVSVSKTASQNQGEQRLNQQNQSPEISVRTDRVILTAVAEGLRKTENRTNQSSAINSQRVTALQERIRNGTYQINPARVADKLLSFEDSLNSNAY